jgi:hypothetical protein
MRELVEIHILSGLVVWVNCWAVEEELDQSRAYLFGRTACGVHVCLHGDG